MVKSHGAAQFIEKMKRVHEEAKSTFLKAQEMMKQNYDQHKNPSQEYKEGDKVWLEETNITTDRPMKKLNDKRYGPFDVIEKVGRASYKLRLPTTWKKVYPVFNEVLLTPFTPAEYPSQKKPEPPPPVGVVDLTEKHHTAGGKAKNSAGWQDGTNKMMFY
jgi:hypothetical protein